MEFYASGAGLAGAHEATATGRRSFLSDKWIMAYVLGEEARARAQDENSCAVATDDSI